MMRGTSFTRRRRLGAVFALAALVTAMPVAAPRAATPVDVVVVDRDGRFADGLGPDSFTVTVDGKPRRVLWVRYVSRGPGAVVEASRRQAARTEALSFAAEPARSLLVVIDELSIQPGAERAATQAAAALVDRLGLDDRVGILRLPVPRDTQMTLTTERPEVRAALRQVVGQAAPGTRPNPDAAVERQAGGAVDPTTGMTGDPERVTVAERPPTELSAAPAASDGRVAPSGLLPNLQAVLTALRSTPGRKVVVVFSAGVPAASALDLDNAALAAASSQAVVHAFGLAGGKDDPDNVLDTTALDRLARATGGTFSMLGRNPDKALERTVTELSASYVLGLESVAADADGRRHPLRIETSRASAAVRAPAWLVARPDADDYLPPPEAARLAPLGADPARGAVVDIGRGTDATDSARAASAARDLEVQRLLARAADYVSGYQREYSMLVVEEHYVQRTRTEQQTLRSDLLLVRPPGLDAWVSFRDVFEVNGRPVRDREDRLKRLFLDGSPEAQAQLAAIKEESARLNIGLVERNINVPLYALKFLEAANLARCQFALSGTKDVSGVAATRVAFREVAKPTLVRRDNAQDLAATGWFLIDPSCGAIVGTMLQLVFPNNGAVIEFNTRYERDASLGLWVPAEMTEAYSVRGTTTERNVVLDARAEYSRFRRFQVTSETETKVKIVK
jgi:VWFA-related protein